MKARIPTFTTAACPKCKRIATVTKHTDEIGGGINHTYYKCGKCNHKHTVCYTDANIREALTEQKVAYNTKSESPEWLEAHAELIQKGMDKLKERIENGDALTVTP